MSVVAVDRRSVEVFAAIQASVVVGDDEKKGGLWCSPRAKTSRPTSSAFCAMARTALSRSRSLGVRPVVGSVVMSLTVKTPNSIAGS
jgi:hypothetical protein